MFTLVLFPSRQNPHSAIRVIIAVLTSGILASCGAPATIRTETQCPAAVAQTSATVVAAPPATSAEPVAHLPASVHQLLQATASSGRPACLMIVGPDAGIQVLDLTPRRPSGAVEN